MVNDLQVYILLAVTSVTLLCLTGISVLFFKKYANKIKQKLTEIKNKTIYNGALRSIYISYMEVCLSTAIQFKLMIKGSKYADPTSEMVAIASAAYLYGVIFWMVLTIFKYKRNFGRKRF